MLRGKLDIDWNFDYLHSGYDEKSKIAETCQIQDDRTLDAENRVRNRMLASKLTMTYPLLGGSLDFGAEYINTNRQDDYMNPQGYVASTYSTLKEQSISPMPNTQYCCLRLASSVWGSDMNT